MDKPQYLYFSRGRKKPLRSGDLVKHHASSLTLNSVYEVGLSPEFPGRIELYRGRSVILHIPLTHMTLALGEFSRLPGEPTHFNLNNYSRVTNQDVIRMLLEFPDQTQLPDHEQRQFTWLRSKLPSGNS